MNSDLFRTLSSLLPEPPQKRNYDDADLVSELITYIQKLEKRNDELKIKRNGLLAASDISACSTEMHKTGVSMLDGVRRCLSDAEDRPTTSNDSSWSCVSSRPRQVAYDDEQLKTVDGCIANIDFSGKEVSITARSGKKDASLFLRMLTLIQEHRLKLIQADLCTGHDYTGYFLHAQVENGREPEFTREALQSALRELLMIVVQT